MRPRARLGMEGWRVGGGSSQPSGRPMDLPLGPQILLPRLVIPSQRAAQGATPTPPGASPRCGHGRVTAPL